MKADVAERWIAALRSGEYEQGRFQLQPELGRYCCLGVLCDLAAQDGVGEWEETPGSRWVRFTTDNSYSTLSEPVMKWAGIKTAHARIPGGGDLTLLNDGGRSFEYIASVIEDNVEAL